MSLCAAKGVILKIQLSIKNVYDYVFILRPSNVWGLMHLTKIVKKSNGGFLSEIPFKGQGSAGSKYRWIGR